jgi:hypothetical protein
VDHELGCVRVLWNSGPSICGLVHDDDFRRALHPLYVASHIGGTHSEVIFACKDDCRSTEQGQLLDFLDVVYDDLLFIAVGSNLLALDADDLRIFVVLRVFGLEQGVSREQRTRASMFIPEGLLQKAEIWTEEDMRRFVVVDPKTRVDLEELTDELRKQGFVRDGETDEDDLCREDFMMCLFLKSDTKEFLEEVKHMFSLVVDKYGKDKICTKYVESIMECVWMIEDPVVLRFIALFMISNEEEIQRVVLQNSNNELVEHFLKELPKLLNEHIKKPYNEINAWASMELFVWKCCICYHLGPTPPFPQDTHSEPQTLNPFKNASQFVGSKRKRL